MFASATVMQHIEDIGMLWNGNKEAMKRHKTEWMKHLMKKQ